jgi:hypothetical protein
MPPENPRANCEQLRGARRTRLRIDTEVRAVEQQDLARGEREIEIRTLAHDADQPLHFHLLRPHVVVADPCLPACRSHACR